MNSIRQGAGGWLVVGAMLLVTAAVATPAGADEATAASFLEHAKRELAAGNFAEACPALMESHRLDPQPSTLFMLAECVFQRDKLAMALRGYEDYLSRYERMPEAEREAARENAQRARQQVSMLKAVVPKLVIEMPNEVPPGTTVEHNGEAVPATRWGKPISVEPGGHEVVVKVPGQQSRRFRAQVDKGDRKVIEVNLRPTNQGERPSAHSSPPDDAAPTGGTQRVAAYALWTVGAAGTVLSIVSGAMALANRSTIKDNCVGALCNQDGKDAADTAQPATTASNIGLIIAGVGGVAGTVLFLTAPSAGDGDTALKAGVRLAVGPRAGSLRLEVRW